MEATTKDLRFHSGELLAAVDRGEEVVVTYRGRPRARLVGLSEDEERKSRQRNVAFGLWSDRTDDVDAQVREMRRGRRFDPC